MSERVALLSCKIIYSSPFILFYIPVTLEEALLNSPFEWPDTGFCPSPQLGDLAMYVFPFCWNSFVEFCVNSYFLIACVYKYFIILILNSLTLFFNFVFISLLHASNLASKLNWPVFNSFSINTNCEVWYLSCFYPAAGFRLHQQHMSLDPYPPVVTILSNIIPDLRLSCWLLNSCLQVLS